MVDYASLTTEERNPCSRGLDQMSTYEILRVINEDHRVIPDVVAQALPEIALAVDLIVERLRQGGSLLYVGAGTSGRLGILDAVECLPTFGVGPEVISAVMAGGNEAVFRAVEVSEDSYDDGVRDMSGRITSKSVVVGISASGVTPYVMGALHAARVVGARTVAIVCNDGKDLGLDVDVVISLPVGPEVLTGSTRMKAGTAQKLVLNMLSTTAMVRLGRVFDNLMIDMQPSNQKLRARAVRIMSMATGLNHEESIRALEGSGWNMKTALVMALAGVDRDKAREAIVEAKGHARLAVQFARGTSPNGVNVNPASS